MEGLVEPAGAQEEVSIPLVGGDEGGFAEERLLEGAFGAEGVPFKLAVEDAGGGVGIGEIGIGGEGPLERIAGGGEDIGGGHPTIVGEYDMGLRVAGEGCGEVGIQFGGGLVEGDGVTESFLGAEAGLIAAFEEEVVGIDAGCWLAIGDPGGEGDIEMGGDGGDDFPLNGEDLAGFTIKDFGPDLAAGGAVDELSGDEEAILGAADGASEEGGDTEFAGDRGERLGDGAKAIGGGAGGEAKLGVGGEGTGEFIGDTIGVVEQGGVGSGVFERQDGEGDEIGLAGEPLPGGGESTKGNGEASGRPGGDGAGEGGGESERGWEALGGIGLKALSDGIGPEFGEVQRLGEDDIASHFAKGEGEGGAGGKDGAAGDEFDGDQSERVGIGGGSDGQAEELFGRHVGGGATGEGGHGGVDVGRGGGGGRVGRSIEAAGKAEIGDENGAGLIRVFREEDVAWFEIAVNNADVVSGLECLGHGGDEGEGAGRRNGAGGGEIVRQGLAAEQAHREEGDRKAAGCVVGEEIVDAADVRMGDLTGAEDFPAEAIDHG